MLGQIDYFPVQIVPFAYLENEVLLSDLDPGLVPSQLVPVVEVDGPLDTLEGFEKRLYQSAL